MKIHVHIERLILDGLDLGPGDGPRVQAAVEAELSRLLAEGSVVQESIAGGMADAWPTGGAVPSVPAAPIQLETGARPASIGGQIARSIYGGIGGKQ